MIGLFLRNRLDARLISMNYSIVLILLLVPLAVFSKEISLSYENRGSEIFELSTVEMSADGQVDITTKRYGRESQSYSLLLEPYMKRHIDDVIQSSVAVGSKGLSDEQTVRRDHEGVIQLRIEAGDQHYEIHSFDRLGLQPLRELIWRLVTQCEVYWGLVNEGNVHALRTAVSPRAAGAKVLDAQAFLHALVEYIDGSDNSSDIRIGLETLQYMLSPQEFAGFISQRLKLDGNQDLWFYAIPYGNLEDAHRMALMPLSLSLLVELDQASDPSEFDQSIFASLLNTLGNNRYVPAIPFILSLESYYSLPYLDGHIAKLSEMGFPALDPINTLMGSNDCNIQLNACELMLLSARLNPHAEYSHPVSEGEYSRISQYISEFLLPKAIRLQAGIPVQSQARLTEIITNTQLELQK